MDDLTLLREYATRNSEAAFETLVTRRVGFVYAAALRQVRDPHLAEEITQAVFIILAQKAGRISDKTILAGWLFKTTRFAAIAQTRELVKRQRRELEVFMQSEIQSAAPDPLWEQMSPLLDEALASLGEKDQQAVLLRFFENKSLAEVGSHLGTGEDTARKRVSRALEKLHRYFNQRGVSSTTAIIAGAISANSVQAAPVALAKSVTAVTIAKGAAASGSTLTLIKGALKIMAWTKVKTAIVVSLGVLLAAGTTTVTVKEIQEHRTYPWEVPSWDFSMVDKVSPQVRIVPTKFFKGGWGIQGEKNIGISFRRVEILRTAKGWPSSARMVLPSNLPTDRYDFIANLPNGSKEALELLVKKKFGLIGKAETRETDVLLLQIKYPGASGLKPDTTSQATQRNGLGMFSVVNQPTSTLTSFLENYFQIPVMDQTGLNGSFDMNLKWQDNWQNRNTEGLKQALVDQLGLELVPTNMPIEMLVVEKVK